MICFCLEKQAQKNIIKITKVFVDQILRLVNPNNTENIKVAVYILIFSYHTHPFKLMAILLMRQVLMKCLCNMKTMKQFRYLPYRKHGEKGGFIRGLKLLGNRTVRLAWKNGCVIQFEILNK